MKINNEHDFHPTMIDGSYVNALVDLVNACRSMNVKIKNVYAYQNGWNVEFEGHPHADAICHDGSYGSPCYGGDMYDAHNNDWGQTGRWETIGFPWDYDDVSVHTAEELAANLLVLNTLPNGVPTPWDEEA